MSIAHVYTPFILLFIFIFATIINHMMKYHSPMINVEWLAAEILQILSSVGLVTGKICWLRICAFVPPMGIKGQLH
jgi:hypothetical protein